MNIYTLYSELNRAPKVEIMVKGEPTVTKELINVSYRVHNGQEFNNHLARNFKLDYVKREIEWYVRGQRYDQSILDHAKIWAGCVGPDGGINSNYGQYLFGPGKGLARVAEELGRDLYSRRAVAMILGEHSLHWCGIDQPCTVSLQFLIRQTGNGFLTMDCIATMRSQDAIFGLSNDVPAFMFILKTMASLMGVAPRALHVNVASLHVYERHFRMVQNIYMNEFGWYCNETLPPIEKDEAYLIVNANSYLLDSALGAWLKSP